MKKKGNLWIAAYSIGVILLFAAILLIPASREIFKKWSGDYAFIMGFFKFALLAMSGEFIAIRLKTKQWKAPKGTIVRMLIWGIIGVAITFMMKIYSSGVTMLMGASVLPGSTNEIFNSFLKAFYTSAVMNLSFGPTFMAFHKCTDKWIDLKTQKAENTGIRAVIDGVNWKTFVTFTLGKTIPLFWIPAHTITFMLPTEYQVVMAASLSIALGIMLSLKK